MDREEGGGWMAAMQRNRTPCSFEGLWHRKKERIWSLSIKRDNYAKRELDNVVVTFGQWQGAWRSKREISEEEMEDRMGRKQSQEIRGIYVSVSDY